MPHSCWTRFVLLLVLSAFVGGVLLGPAVRATDTGILVTFFSETEEAESGFEGEIDGITGDSLEFASIGFETDFVVTLITSTTLGVLSRSTFVDDSFGEANRWRGPPAIVATRLWS